MKVGLNSIALLALESTFISTAELIWLFSSQTVGKFLTEMLPNVFPILIGIMCIVEQQRILLKCFIVGLLIIHLLVGTGFSFLIGCINLEQAYINSTAASTLSQLTLMISVPFAILFVLSDILSHYGPGLRETDNSLFLAYATGALLLAFELMWLIFKYKTHDYMFGELADREEEPEPGDPSPAPEHVRIPLQWRVAYFLWLAAAPTLAVKCLANIISTPAWPVAEAIFGGSVLLPAAISASGIVKTCNIARSGRMQLVIHLTVETAIGISFFTLPILILIDALMANDAVIWDFPVILTASLFLTVFTVGITIKDGTLNYMKGVMYLALYLVIALSLYIAPYEHDSPFHIVTTPKNR
ncbi:uncharacterized protein BDV17DRAFT_263030 [Aspergillus undulatus]|uniref:uncharacterized protein n=1 Tax=Aspergillus undulatus TaxID=1810928 RepID=UPI003CCE2B8D